MKRIKPTALWPAVLLVIALCLLIGESDLLWKVQQYNLFLYSKHFFLQQISLHSISTMSGWASCCSAAGGRC